LGGTGALWRPVVDELADDCELVVPDLPGFGRSPELPSGTPATAANLAGAVVELCEELGVERPHVAGISLGGWVALELAKAGAVRSALAISPAGMWRDPLGARRFERQRLGRLLLPIARGALATRRGREALLQSNFARPERVPKADAREIVEGYLTAPGYPAASLAMRTGAFEHEGRVSVPVTVVWGERDRIVGRPSRRRLPPGVGYSAMPGWGHVPTWDDPRGVADLVRSSDAGRQASPR